MIVKKIDFTLVDSLYKYTIKNFLRSTVLQLQIENKMLTMVLKKEVHSNENSCMMKKYHKVSVKKKS